MKHLLFLFALGFACASPARATTMDGVDVFKNGLKAYQTNGPAALLSLWYPLDERETVEKLQTRLLATTKDLGDVVEVEVFAPRNIGRHLQHLYGVIYFRKRPLWIRADYYAIDGRAGFLSMEFSINPDDILPLTIGVNE